MSVEWLPPLWRVLTEKPVRVGARGRVVGFGPWGFTIDVCVWGCVWVSVCGFVGLCLYVCLTVCMYVSVCVSLYVWLCLWVYVTVTIRLYLAGNEVILVCAYVYYTWRVRHVGLLAAVTSLPSSRPEGEKENRAQEQGPKKWSQRERKGEAVVAMVQVLLLLNMYK